MQYDVKTPAEYFQMLDDDWRRAKLQQLRELILLNAPGVTESIQYKMLCYGDGSRAVFHLNAQKNYVSLYVGDLKKIDPTGELVNGLNMGKSCIRFNKSIALSDTRIDELIESAVQLWQRGENVGC